MKQLPKLLEIVSEPKAKKSDNEDNSMILFADITENFFERKPDKKKTKLWLDMKDIEPIGETLYDDPDNPSSVDLAMAKGDFMELNGRIEQKGSSMAG